MCSRFFQCSNSLICIKVCDISEMFKTFTAHYVGFGFKGNIIKKSTDRRSWLCIDRHLLATLKCLDYLNKYFKCEIQITDPNIFEVGKYLNRSVLRNYRMGGKFKYLLEGKDRLIIEINHYRKQVPVYLPYLVCYSELTCILRGKLFGLYPFAGNYKNLSFCYSLVVWIALCYASIKVHNIFYEYSDTIPSSQKLLKYVILFETYVILITLVINIILSTNKSKRFFKILDLFHRFDELILQVQCSSNYKAQQFYVIYALLIWVYHISVMVMIFFDIFFLLFMWSTICLSSTIAILPYIICIRMLRHRYKLANKVFKNSISNPTTTTKCFYPTEVHNVFIELRNLTEEMQFVFFLVREAHNTIQESKKTVLIAHDTLRITSNTGIIKEFEVFVLSCWNNPIIFDVYDFFDLDYALLQSVTTKNLKRNVKIYKLLRVRSLDSPHPHKYDYISMCILKLPLVHDLSSPQKMNAVELIIASIVTYIVVLVQIQLAISSQ
ncbi:hypothetical protein AGLY_013763 [Aphis glycines]|uniref:Gustatory receptor n=1 Tax=Aphis glycines TaxID=307491 RepID=A0A6G0T6B4_APHGL|nr:hypothetical protein AGLY_013763 [Aphis glycines]